MKNIVIKIVTTLIILILILIPTLAAVNINNSNIKLEPKIVTIETTTIEEPAASVESEEIKMITDFSDKLNTIQTIGKKPTETELSTEEPATVVILNEEETTTRKYTTKETTNVVTQAKETTTKENKKEEPATIADETTTCLEVTTMKEPETASPSTNDYNKWQYEAAITVWNYLKSLGYNNYICAGIMGNIMSECGGHTLYLEWWLNDNGYYGICQWSKAYCPEVFGRDLETQLNYLAKTIAGEFNNFGYKYYSGFNYNKFLQLTSIEEAAEAFAACYERCATWTYSSRVSNGYKAYQYFVG